MKSAYRVVDVADNTQDPTDSLINFPWKLFWKMNIPQRILHFLRKCVHGCLPVRDILSRHVQNIDPICPLCNRETETMNHLFLECHETKNIWDAMKISSRGISRGHNMLDWISSRFSSGSGANTTFVFYKVSLYYSCSVAYLENEVCYCF